MQTEGNVADTNEKAGETEQEEKEEDTRISTEECLSASARKLRSTSNDEDVYTSITTVKNDNGYVFF